MLCQTHIGYQYWQAPGRNTLPPTSHIAPRTFLTNRGHLHTRYTVENCFGAWPGDNKFNCPLGYGAPDPTLLPLDRWSNSKGRWIDIGAGGTDDVEFDIKGDEDWLTISQTNGKIKGDGSSDVRIWLSVDWSKFPTDVASAEAHATFTSTDGATIIATIPANNFASPPADFHGAIQGDGYVAFEAAHFQSSNSGKKDWTDYSWEVVSDYGRTMSGMAVYPLTSAVLQSTERPSISYDFWVTEPTKEGEVEITLHLGPSLNFFLGQKLEFGLQLDDGEVSSIQPVPDAPLGSLPDDWEDVVAAEIRVVKTSMKLGGSGVGKHRLTVLGTGTGVVLERVMIDFGGIASRGASYLGPPESVIV